MADTRQTNGREELLQDLQGAVLQNVRREIKTRLPVRFQGKHVYDIVLDRSFDGLAVELLKLSPRDRKLCIVTDSNVASYYLKEVEAVASACFPDTVHFIFPAGEESKNLDTVKALYEMLVIHRFDRHDYLLALGGGVVGDLCGFAAATYLRGISFIQVPTTLLAQVDSSIGGKTGVDFDAYKNMVGAFHMPCLVYTNGSVLSTLSEEQFSSGMGEVMKHGLIRDGAYFKWLSDHLDAILQREVSVCGEMVEQSNRIKREIVERDPKELGERALLNFGHTLGHAIERLSEFGLPHGHCVALGCIAAMELSVNRGAISKEEPERLRKLMKRLHMPVTVSGLSCAEIIETTKNDKKMDSGAIRFILLHRVGEAYIDPTVTDEEMAAGLASILT